MTALLLTLLLAFAPPAKASPTAKAAAELSLVAPAETKVYYPVVVSLRDATPTTQVKWTITPTPVWKESIPTGVRFTGPPQTYHIRALYVDFDAKLFGEVEADAAIVGESPPPNPGPGPGPGPTPPPTPNTPSKIWVVVVEETSQAAANRGAIFGDPSLNAYMASKGHHWRIVDKDVVGPDGQPPADVKRFIDKAAGRPYPSVFFVDEKGKIRGEARIAPTDTAANVLGILKTFDGSAK